MDQDNHNPAANIRNPNDLTVEQKIMLTLWAEELENHRLPRCVQVYNRQSVAGKMILFYEYKYHIISKISELYRLCTTEHLTNEDDVTDYLGYRIDEAELYNRLYQFDVSYASHFERKVACDLGVMLLRDDDEVTTEEYNSEVGECETLDDF